MPRIYCEFRSPCCGKASENPQTKKSIVLRTIGIGVAILGAAIGIYFLTQSNLLVGLLSFSAAPPLLFLGLFFGQYAQPDIDERWVLSEEERAALNYIATDQCLRAGDYVGGEIILAFECMFQGRPENFRIPQRQGQGSHVEASNNARNYLGDNVKEGSFFLQIINTYKNDQKKIAKKHGEVLETLVGRIRLMLAQID